MNSQYFWTCIAGLALGTFSIRSSFLIFGDRIQLPESAQTVFRLLPAAILPALVAPMVFFHQGSVAGLFYKERLVVLLASMAVCFWTRSMSVTVAFGLIALYLSHWLS